MSAPRDQKKRETTMFTVIVQLHTNEVLTWKTFSSKNAAIRSANSFQIESWVIETESRKFVYTNGRH